MLRKAFAGRGLVVKIGDIDSAELDVDPNTGLIKFSKVLSVSYKSW